ncbi:MAG: RsmE family RNA methyltransferase, partial [Metamycoplasmataceae bacterium]
VGPEGGFTENEIEMAANFGFEVVSLGSRILRAETSSIFLLSIIK